MNMPCFVPDRENPAVDMILDTYAIKKPVEINTPLDHLKHIHLLDFHSTVSLHPLLKGAFIDTIIDHHLEGDLYAPNMVIDPIGATSTLVAEIFPYDIPEDVALMIGFGICDDTAGGVLHATERDIEILKKVAYITGKDPQWFMAKLKEAYLGGFKVDADTRTYTIGGYTITIGQFRAPGALSEENIMRTVSEYIWSLSCDMCLYIVSDPEKGKSLIVGKADNKDLLPLMGKLSGTHKLLSRKVDVLPYIKGQIEGDKGE
jgi:inorganic pyrophosphatase/exopolyphosphatase